LDNRQSARSGLGEMGWIPVGVSTSTFRLDKPYVLMPTI
jgi:hypothetical protein